MSARRRFVESATLVIHQQLKARAHKHFFGTRVCRVDSAWLGARAWAGGGAHVAALEGSRVAVYESAVCIVLSGNICIVHEMPARLPGCSVGESTDSRELESRPEMQGLTKKRWKEYAQASLDASIESMPGRLESVLYRRKGEYLMKGEDY